MAQKKINFVDEYVNWIRSETRIKQLGEWTEISSPLLDRHNDFLQIYIRQVGDKFELTDDGYTIADLEASGCELDSPKRKKILEATLNGFGVQKSGTALVASATKENFALKKHNLLQAMLTVNDLFFTSKPMVQSLFLEDVVGWLEANRIRYVPNSKFVGKSGFDHLFDFVIPHSLSKPERLVQAINNPTRAAAEAFAFSWVDTESNRPEGATAYAILNDQYKAPPSNVLQALLKYNINPVRWSEREQVLPALQN